MSRQPEELEGFKQEIHEAFLACGASVPTLFARFQEQWFTIGRRVPRGAGMPAFRSWMDGKTEPSLTEYYFVAKALNTYLEEIGAETRLWEIERPPSFAPRGDGDGASESVLGSETNDHAKGGTHRPEPELKGLEAA